MLLKSNRVIEVVRVAGKQKQPPPTLILQFFTRYKVQEMTATKMEGLQPIDIRSDHIRKQPPVDKKCRTCKKTKLLHEFDLYDSKRDTSCKDCRNKELDELPVYYCKCPIRPDRRPEPWIRDILDIDDESLTELIHQGMLKMLQRMHDERSPLDVAEIQDKFVNTLLALAEHLNRLRYCRNRFVGSTKFKDVYGDHPHEVARD